MCVKFTWLLLYVGHDIMHKYTISMKKIAIDRIIVIAIIDFLP